MGDREQILHALKDKIDKFDIMDMSLMTSFLENQGDGVELPSFPVCKVETLQSRFQDVVEAIKNKTKSFVESQNGNISLVLFDLMMGDEKAFEDAITFTEVIENKYIFILVMY